MSGWQAAALAVPAAAVVVTFALIALVRAVRAVLADQAEPATGERPDQRFADPPLPLAPLFGIALLAAVVLGAGWILVYSGSWGA